ncbi:hypothetical protein F5878DRAFT_639798 [Lentinula raphanica]|uniref:Uncharacterized protein n=1 Tax=Lentinula raphanica TaxID=153919 RepID=A0AA38UJV8_9AGAR|nr:hypothetical protein F5878DRAFT_639798 [Lentinula raphanica]
MARNTLIVLLYAIGVLADCSAILWLSQNDNQAPTAHAMTSSLPPHILISTLVAHHTRESEPSLSFIIFILIIIVTGASTTPLPEFEEYHDTLLWQELGFAIDEPSSFFLHRRDESDSGSHCHNLTKTEQLEKSMRSPWHSLDPFSSLSYKVPGWDTLLEIARKRYGKGSRNILVYDEHYPEVDSAKVCVPSHAIPIQLDGSPSCHVSNASAGGEITGTHGIVSVRIETGHRGSSISEIGEAAAYGDLGSFTARFWFPIGGLRNRMATIATRFINEQFARIELSINDMVSTIYNMTVQDGQSCQAVETIQTCTFKGTGKIPFTASGNVWFEYDDRTYNHELENSKHQSKHYKYAFDLTEVLPDESQRTLYATFGGAFNVESHGRYEAVCTEDEDDD